MTALVGMGLVSMDGFVSVCAGVEKLVVQEKDVSPSFIKLLSDYYRSIQ